MLPIVTFEPVKEDSSDGQPLMRDIANGEWDAYFTEWATAAKANGKPMGFRFAQEMNGNWYSWSDGRFGNASGDYVRAWRHLHDLFAEVGADNLIWIWSVNRINNLPDKTLARVYPGAKYVDWVGMSGYYRDEGVEPSFSTTFDATLAEIEGDAIRLPMIERRQDALTGIHLRGSLQRASRARRPKKSICRCRGDLSSRGR